MDSIDSRAAAINVTGHEYNNYCGLTYIGGRSSCLSDVRLCTHSVLTRLNRSVYYSRAGWRGRHLFEGGVYLRAVFTRGRCLFEGGVYSRAVFIRGQCLLEGGVYYFGVEDWNLIRHSRQLST